MIADLESTCGYVRRSKDENAKTTDMDVHGNMPELLVAHRENRNVVSLEVDPRGCARNPRFARGPKTKDEMEE